VSRKYFSIYIFIVVFYCTNVIAAWGNYERRYSHPTLDRLYADINNRYINLSTKEVAQRAMRDETSVARHFEQEFLTDTVENEPISDERKNREIMRLLRIVQNQSGTSGFKVAIAEFKEDVAIDLDNKEKALTNELNGYSIPKIVAGCVLVTGLGVVVGGSIQSSGRDQKILGGVGSGIAVIAGGYLYSLSGRAELLKTHIVQVQAMKKGWEKF